MMDSNIFLLIFNFVIFFNFFLKTLVKIDLREVSCVFLLLSLQSFLQSLLSEITHSGVFLSVVIGAKLCKLFFLQGVVLRY